MSTLQFTPRVWAAAGAVAAASMASPAQAVVLTSNPILSSNTVLADAEIGGTSSGSISALQISIGVEQFDSSLGTLLSIELGWSENFFSFSEGLATANLAFCEGDCIYEFGVEFGVVGSLTTPDGPTNLATAGGSGNGSTTGTGGTANFNYSLTPPSLASSPIDIGSSPFASFIGSGDWQAAFDFSAVNILFFSFCEDGDTGFCTGGPNPAGEFWPAESLFWNVNGLQVTYTYETDTVEVPEPGTLIPFGLGLGILALYAVRYRSRKRDSLLELR